MKPMHGKRGPGLALLLGEGEPEKGEGKPKAKREASKLARAAAKDMLSALEAKDEAKLARALDAMLGSDGED